MWFRVCMSLPVQCSVKRLDQPMIPPHEVRCFELDCSISHMFFFFGMYLRISHFYIPSRSLSDSRDSRTDVLVTLNSSRYDPTFEHRFAGPGNEAFKPSLRTNWSAGRSTGDQLKSLLFVEVYAIKARFTVPVGIVPFTDFIPHVPLWSSPGYCSPLLGPVIPFRARLQQLWAVQDLRGVWERLVFNTSSSWGNRVYLVSGQKRDHRARIVSWLGESLQLPIQHVDIIDKGKTRWTGFCAVWCQRCRPGYLPISRGLVQQILPVW